MGYISYILPLRRKSARAPAKISMKRWPVWPVTRVTRPLGGSEMGGGRLGKHLPSGYVKIAIENGDL